MSDNPVDRCKALFEAARADLRDAIFHEPLPEIKWCEARTELQSLSPDDLLERWEEEMEGMNTAALWGILDTDPRGADQEQCTLEGIRQFEESVDDVVFLIYEATERELKGGPLKGGGEGNSDRFEPFQVSVSEWREEVRRLLDRIDSEVLSWCTDAEPEPLDTYQYARETIYRMAFQTPSHGGLLACEIAHRLQTMSQEALDMFFDSQMKKLYFDAYHNILGKYTKEDSEKWFLELRTFENDAFTVELLIFEALDREAAGTAERVSKWRGQILNFLYRTQSCGRPCFHAGIVPEDPTYDGRYPFPCDEEHQTSEESHKS